MCLVFVDLHVRQLGPGADPLADPVREEARPVLHQAASSQEVLGVELIRLSPQLGVLLIIIIVRYLDTCIMCLDT